MDKNGPLRLSVMSPVGIIVGLVLVATMMTCGSLGLVAWLYFSGQVTVDHRYVTFDVAADGKTMVFAAADDDLYEFDLGARQVTPITTTAEKERSPGYSPDGKSIVYAAGSEDDDSTHINLRSLESGRTTRLTEGTDCSDDCPSFSPDGSQIVFARAHRHRPYSMGGWTWDDWDVYVVNVDGSNLRRITSEKHYQLRWPRFTCDGKRIYYSTIADRVKADTTYVNRVVDLSGKAQPGPLERPKSGNRGTGAWASDTRQSFDGQRFVFISDRHRPYSYDVGISDSTGTTITAVGVAGTVSKFNNNPVLTPNNRRILFLASDVDRIGSADIRSLWEVQADGSKPRQLADAGLFTNPRSWNSRVQSQNNRE